MPPYRTRTVKKTGVEITVRHDVTLEIKVSEDMADCVLHQLDAALNCVPEGDVINEDGDSLDCKDLTNFADAIREALT